MDLSQSDMQSNATSLTRTAEDIMERFGTQDGMKHENSILVSQNVAAPTISEVEKRRMHELLKRKEDELEMVRDYCKREIKEVKDDCNQKLQIKEDECDRKLKEMEARHKKEIKIKEDEFNQKLEKVEVDVNRKIKEVKDDCNQKLQIKDDECDRKLKEMEARHKKEIKIKEDEFNQKLEKVEVDFNQKLQIKEGEYEENLKIKEGKYEENLKGIEAYHKETIESMEDNMKRDSENHEVGMFCFELTKNFEMTYPLNFTCTYGLLWKWLIFIVDYISADHSELKGSGEENDRVFPTTTEENDEESVGSVSDATCRLLMRKSDVLRQCSDKWFINYGVGSSYGSKGRKKFEDLNHEEHRVECFLKKMILTATENSESFTKEGMKSTPIELPGEDEIDEVLQSIRDFFIQGLSGLQPGKQNEDNAETKETQEFGKIEESGKERITSSECEAKQSLELVVNKLKREVDNLNAQIDELNKNELVVDKLKREVDNLNAQIDELELTLNKNDEELRETLLQLGSLSVEHTKMLKENKINEEALMKLQLKQTSTQSVQTVQFESSYSQASSSDSSSSAEPSSSTSRSTLGAEAVTKPDETTQEEAGAVGGSPVDETPVSLVKVSTEESSDREGISLGNVPTTAVERSLYNNYNILLLIMAQRLLLREVVKLKEWAEETFSIDTSRDAIDIFRKLDQQEVVSASNLALLREFFEKILRIDLAHLIDCFMRGDYSLLRNTNSSFPRNGPGIPDGRFASRSPQGATGTLYPRREPSPTWDGMNTRFSKAVEVNEAFVVDGSALEAARVNYHSPAPACRDENPSISRRNELGVLMVDGPAYNSNGARNRAVEQREQGRATESGTPVENRAINHGSKPSHDIGSNGQKLSKFQKQDSQRNSRRSPQNSDDDSDDDDGDEQWLCNHYKRRCHVKFACCDKFWPCHRCHNAESNCGQKKLKSIHTKFVKCVKCDTEQEFTERSQFCINCHSKFAKYFCLVCKHLTGKDDKPYHCGKCGICRIHKHRSFHCDVCGVCLDVQLRDNHKCRAGSAHDECCICLEDAFTGCQILPCSHKVHKECATRMIRSGITRCPICRESFAHKLEKRPAHPPRKHHGKK